MVRKVLLNNEQQKVVHPNASLSAIPVKNLNENAELASVSKLNSEISTVQRTI